jgi:hypothetical protein
MLYFGMTKQDFQLLADVIKAHPEATAKDLAPILCIELKARNPRFDSVRFLEACGVIRPDQVLFTVQNETDKTEIRVKTLGAAQKAAAKLVAEGKNASILDAAGFYRSL